MKTERNLKRTGVIKPDNIEEMNRPKGISKQKEKETVELAQELERQKRNSIQQIQKDKMEEQQKKTEEIIKALDKEIEEKEN